VNHATDKVQDKPVLNPESFQWLLAAAYLLQGHNEQQPSIRPQLLGASPTSSFSAGKIIQKRTPAVMIRDRQLEAGQPDVIAGNQTAKERPYLARRVPFVRSAVPHRMTVLLKKPIYWRTVETVAIAMVFCMMMGLSILRLSAVPGRTSLASGALEKQDNFQPTRAAEPILALSQTVAPLNSRESPRGDETGIVAEDIVIRHQERAVNVPGKPSLRLFSDRNMGVVAADTVVEYGSDVTMWSRKPERATLNRLGH
jgi:hypothetical protein